MTIPAAILPKECKALEVYIASSSCVSNETARLSVLVDILEEPAYFCTANLPKNTSDEEIERRKHVHHR